MRYHTPAGPEGVETLCLALRDSSNAVRLAAAQKLVLGGDRRAIEPLVQALQATYATRWPQLQMGLSALSLLIVFAGILVMVSLTFAVDGWFLALFYALVLLWIMITRYGQEARERSELRSAIAHALTQITEREPSAVPAQVVADLRAFSSDLIEQDGASRRVCAEAADRIEAATKDCRLLPVPAVSGPIVSD